MSYTPGPWINGLAPEDDEMCPYAHEVLGAPEGELRLCVAIVQKADDARLIAAAPELLEALRNLLVRCSAELADPIDVPEVYAARLAIAKATGAQP